jgi:uncharacterized membrane protein (DUF106 family)
LSPITVNSKLSTESQLINSGESFGLNSIIPLQNTYSTFDQKKSNEAHKVKSNNSLLVLNQQKKQLKKENNHLKKTLMLLLVCILLLLVELPHSLFLFIAVFENYLYIAYYLPLKEFIDLLVMITYIFNFIIYCFMSKLFRKQFVSFYIKYSKFNLKQNLK